jgi:formamidopyrimidine-DNA glycosylase
VPELPEVETMRRGIACIVGSRVRDVDAPRCRKRPILIRPRIASFRRRVVGRTIAGVDRLGKRVIIQLSGGDSIVIEPRMTGLVLLASPPTTDHLRWRMTLSGAPPELLFWDRRGLGQIRLLNAQEFRDVYSQDRLGPDALNTTWQELCARLSASRRPVKVALLDQRAVAGIGNLYASEILYLAGIHPAIPCDRLRPSQWRKIHSAMLEVLHHAIAHEGSTLSDGTYRNALNNAGSYQHHHRVYDRAGKRCDGCSRHTIQRIVQSQRSTFYCPRCQRQPSWLTLA